MLPVVTVVTDNRAPIRSFWFEAFIELHPELHHVRTRTRTPGQNGSRMSSFGSMKYEWMFREEIDDCLSLVEQIEADRLDDHHVRPHEAVFWNLRAGGHAGIADPAISSFENEDLLPTS